MFAAIVAISVKMEHPEPLQRSILNPSSLLELSAQERFIWLEETADALRPPGAGGGDGNGGGGGGGEGLGAPP